MSVGHLLEEKREVGDDDDDPERRPGFGGRPPVEMNEPKRKRRGGGEGGGKRLVHLRLKTRWKSEGAGSKSDAGSIRMIQACKCCCRDGA